MSRKRDQKLDSGTSRREFIKASSLLVVGGSLSGDRAARAYGTEPIRVGLIGCGSRGTAAAVEALHTADAEGIRPQGPVQLVALADVFTDRLQRCYRTVKGQHPERVAVPPDRQFVGLDAYRRLLECPLDLVLLATPPGFRPLHFEAAVERGRHVFLEKPLATDPAGIRRLLVANQRAQSQGLRVAVGLQRRHESKYREVIARLQQGAIGDMIYTRAYWTGGAGAVKPRQPAQTELEYQLRNWHNFNWLSGDPLCEQHIHNLDVSNWLMAGPPEECQGQGGRQVRTGDQYGQVFDHHFLEYTYPRGVKLFSQCRFIPGCWNAVAEYAHGTRGHADISGAKIYGPDGKLVWHGSRGGGGHQSEMDALFRCLRQGDACNEIEQGAASTLTAIMGRMASYSGRPVRWSEAVASDLLLADVDRLQTLQDPAPVQPLARPAVIRETYPIAAPGEAPVS